MTDTLVRFHGSVACLRGDGPLGLTLRGATGTPPGEPAVLAFSAAAPSQFPDVLVDALIERAAPGRYRIASAEGEWLITARAVHLHLDVALPFYRALPPRRVPLARRLFLTAVLALAGSRAGLALLRALRR
jgi:hypothetical protein